MREWENEGNVKMRGMGKWGNVEMGECGNEGMWKWRNVEMGE